MPELPEVETTKRGIAPHIENQSIVKAIVRNQQLRWPIDSDLSAKLEGQVVTAVTRRAKYLLLQIGDHGTLILHLGMSGSLRVLPQGAAVQKHDHFELQLSNNKILRLNDPRRFGAVLWSDQDINQHKLIRNLGPEPNSAKFDTLRLYQLSRKRKLTVKQFIMDGKTVVGVGNIYASESLFRAGIDPRRAAGSISKARYMKLTETVNSVISKAIAAGGTTLQDFTQPDGKPGYFKQELTVYGKAGEPCSICQSEIQQEVIAQRNTFYCKRCQT